MNEMIIGFVRLKNEGKPVHTSWRQQPHEMKLITLTFINDLSTIFAIYGVMDYTILAFSSSKTESGQFSSLWLKKQQISDNL